MSTERIYAIDWLKGVMILCVIFFHSYFFQGFRGYLAVDVFFYISGYFLMSGFLRKPTTAFRYTWGRIRRVAAPYFISLFFFLIIYVRHFAAIDSFSALVDMTGKVFSHIPFSEEFGGQFTRTTFLLGCWFISVLILGSFILYGMLQYNERLATLVLFPAIVLLGYNALLDSSACLDNFTQIGVLGAPLIRGICDMAAGALICYVCVHHRSGVERHATLINVLGLVSFVLFAALMFTKQPLDKYMIITVPWVLTASVMEHSWLNAALQRIHGGLLARLGRYTIYLYCIHGVAQTLIFWFNDQVLNHAMNEMVLFFAYIATIAVATVVLYYLCKWVERRFARYENQSDHTCL